MLKGANSTEFSDAGSAYATPLSDSPASLKVGHFKKDRRNYLWRQLRVARGKADLQPSSGLRAAGRCGRRETDVIAKDPRCSPKRVLVAHATDQGSDLSINLGSASGPPRLPVPIGSKAAAMPAEHCLA